MLVELNEKEVEVLKKVLGEAYDAVTDHKNIKDLRQPERNYFSHVMKRIKNALEEEGIKAKVFNNGWGLLIGKYTVLGIKADDNSGYKFIDGPNAPIGPESDHLADYSNFENSIELRIFEDELFDTAEFDVRNTPSIVKWIISHIKR